VKPHELYGAILNEGAHLVWPSALSQGSSGDDSVRVVVKGKVRGYVTQRAADVAANLTGLMCFDQKGEAILASPLKRRKKEPNP
jgi:hypothetical protein